MLKYVEKLFSENLPKAFVKRLDFSLEFCSAKDRVKIEPFGHLFESSGVE